MPQIDLTDEHAAALLRELDRIIQNDRYPLSPRVLTLKEIPRDAAAKTGTRATAAAEEVRVAADRPASPLVGKSDALVPAPGVG